MPACAPEPTTIGVTIPPGTQGARPPVSKPPFASCTAAVGTVSVTVVVCVALWLVPRTVIVYVPLGALAFVTVIVDDEPAVAEAGLKVTVAPAGAPAAEKVIVSAERTETLVAMVEVADSPAGAETAAGLAPSEKSLPITVSVTIVVWVALGSSR